MNNRKNLQSNISSPISRKLFESGELNQRIVELKNLQNPCRICPRSCLVSREFDDLGICQASTSLKISSAFSHFGEEPELVGLHGSGTFFLSHCNLLCEFCQNCEISHFHEGQTISPHQMAMLMVRLQKQGCHNINFVTPTHYVPQIIESVQIALQEDLTVPLVYNCGGYESVETLQLLESIIDIYMPDFKFATEKSGKKYADAPDYYEIASAAITEMHRQVGDLIVDKNGLAKQGLLIRHLVLPGLVEESKNILKFIARNLSTNSYVNLMAQYHPAHHSHKFPELKRRITYSEIQEVKNYARTVGLHRGF